VSCAAVRGVLTFLYCAWVLCDLQLLAVCAALCRECSTSLLIIAVDSHDSDGVTHFWSPA
jgi:hypothetical protein